MLFYSKKEDDGAWDCCFSVRTLWDGLLVYIKEENCAWYCCFTVGRWWCRLLFYSKKTDGDWDCCFIVRTWSNELRFPCKKADEGLDCSFIIRQKTVVGLIIYCKQEECETYCIFCLKNKDGVLHCSFTYIKKILKLLFDSKTMMAWIALLQ